MPTLYIETSIVSYLRQRPSTRIVTAARQVLTRQWWNHERSSYELVTSQFGFCTFGTVFSGRSVLRCEGCKVGEQVDGILPHSALRLHW